MLTDKKIVNKVVNKARSDLRAFFNDNFIQSDYASLLADLRKIDPLFFNHEFNDMGVLTFSENLLNWLEVTREEESYPPWIENEEGSWQIAEEKGNENLISFLNHLKMWINRLASTGYPSYHKPFDPLFLGFKWMEFKDWFIEKNLLRGKWDIVFSSASKEDKEYLGNFISWLVLIGKKRGPKTLQIMYDKERLSELTCESEIGISMSRLRKVLLHELGHARTRLKHYDQRFHQEKGIVWIESHPLHEYEAWTYALSIKSSLSCIRARLTRITENGDSEWRAFI